MSRQRRAEGHVLVHSSDSDEPVALDPPARPQSRSRSPSIPLASLRVRPLSGGETPDPPGPSKPRKRGRPKKAAPPVDVEDDEVVFLRETTVRELSSRFRFDGVATASTSSASTSRSTPSLDSAAGSTSSAVLVTPLPLLPSLPEQPPLPIPPWLGRAAVLLPLKSCVLCRMDFKKRESGASKWRHISTCLPPAYRPPKPGPDLQALISAALEPPQQDLTLLGRRAQSAAASEVLYSDVPGLAAPRRVLHLTTVTASHSRDDWEDEVDGRVADLVGYSSPIYQLRRSRSRSQSASGSRSRSPSASLHPSRSPTRTRSHTPETLPPTQPLGGSALADEFARPRHSEMPEGEDLMPQAPPVIGLSQAVKDSFAKEEAARTRRAALSSAVDEEESDDGGGYHLPSQRPSTQSPVRPSPTRRTPEKQFHGGGFKRPPSQTPFPARGDEPDSSEPSTSASDSGDRRSLSGAMESLAVETPTKDAEISIIDLCSSSSGSSKSRDPSPTPRRADNLRTPRAPLWAHAESPTPMVVDSDSDIGDLFGAENVEDLDDTPYIVPEGETTPPIVSDDDWGRDAILEWGGITDASASEPEPSTSGRRDMVVESTDDDEPESFDLDAVSDEENDIARDVMPDYTSWDILDLKRLVKSYGYRPMAHRPTLEKLAASCWEALHSQTAATPRPTGKGKEKTKVVVPAVTARVSRKESPQLSSVETDDAAASDPNLDGIFYRMLTHDDTFYNRILLYEPISFDELVSRSIAAGANGIGWRARLKRYLDLQGVTYYTQDPTAPRRGRH